MMMTSYDAWKTRAPDDCGNYDVCRQCGSEVPCEEPLCEDCLDAAELNSLHADAQSYGEEIFDFWDGEAAP